MDDLGRFAAEFTEFVQAMALAAKRPENPVAARSALTRRLLGQGGEGRAPAPPYPAMLHALGAQGVALPPGLLED